MPDLKIEYIPIDEIETYAGNAKLHPAEQIEQIKKSIHTFGFRDPIGIWKGTIVEGHGRYIAAKEMGIDRVPVIRLDDLTDAQRKEYALVHNKLTMNSDFDLDTLQQELEDIADEDPDIDMADFGFDDDFAEEALPKYDHEDSGSLAEKFLVPPFSVLDTRQGYWQDRKREWLSLGIASGDGRKEGLIGDGLKDLAQSMGVKSLTGTSIFDPVLAELMYTWFCIPGGTILDPFAGGSVRGIVAQYLGYDYTGVDLSRKQIEANYEQAETMNVSPKWYCDDSRNIDKYSPDEVDMVFSCPPYFDLEVYSDDPKDLSNMTYEDFLRAYEDIISKCLTHLKENRFAVFVVGDVRDKKTGFYRDFVSDTIKTFIKHGALLYNHMVLFNCISTAALRAKRQFSAMRKPVSVHQDVLVFFKGNPKEIKEEFPEVEVADITEDDVDDEIPAF